MAVVRDRNTVDSVVRIAFGNRTFAVYRTSALVADTGHSNTANCEVVGSDTDYATTVTGWIVQTDDVSHNPFFLAILPR